MLRSCSVPLCPTVKSHRSLHYLPSNHFLRMKWINVLKLNKKKVSKRFQVCSSHFAESDFLPSNSDRIFLKRSIVPSKNLPSIVSKVPPRKPPKERQHFSIEENIQPMSTEEDNPIIDPMTYQQNTEEPKAVEPDENIKKDDVSGENIKRVRDAIENLILNLEDTDESEEDLSEDDNAHFLNIESETLKLYADKCIQVNTLHDIKLTEPGFIDMLKTDGDIRSFTGLSGFDLLGRIITCMKHVKSIEDDLKKILLPLDVAIILVFTKIKVNLSYRQCGVLFKLHPNTISKIFSKMLPLLRAVLSGAVFWPSKELNSRNIPKCFKPDFVNCRAICDCTEVEIQKLKSVKSRIKSYSHYKGKHTMKFKITINPFGLITHASSAYGGKASDKHIFLNEGLVELLEESDAVMVDKGYAIAAEVIGPPILDLPQLSHEDSILNTSIARSRVHLLQRSLEYLPP